KQHRAAVHSVLCRDYSTLRERILHSDETYSSCNDRVHHRSHGLLDRISHSPALQGFRYGSDRIPQCGASCVCPVAGCRALSLNTSERCTPCPRKRIFLGKRVTAASDPKRVIGLIEIPQCSGLLPYRGMLFCRSEARELMGSETA